MPPEILNTTEITQIISNSPYQPGHQPLLTALAARYPNTPFRLVAERDGRSRSPGIVDSDCNRVSDSLVKWINQELSAAGGDAREVWRRHKDTGLIRTEWVGSILYLNAPYGTEPDAFHQLEIEAGEEQTVQYVFETDARFGQPEDRQDLISGPCMIFPDTERKTLTPFRYQFDKLTNIRRFLRELIEVTKANRLAELPELEKKIIHIQDIVIGPGEGSTSYDIPYLEMDPDWLGRPPAEARLFVDWQESSAGRFGHRLCDHWFMQLNDWTDLDGRRFLSLIPQWADADGGIDLPEIQPDWDDSPYGVMEDLSQFDRRTDYPFSWYFYMLHGNRISSSAAGVIARAIRDGLLNLPECDQKVLLRWRENSYGFPE